MKASFVYVLSAALLVVWCAEGNLSGKFKAIFRSPICLAFLGSYLIYVMAVGWTDNIEAGWSMVDRQTPFLLFSLYWSSAEPECRERYISAFIGGVVVCALFAHYNLLQLYWLTEWPRGIRVSKGIYDTAPFVDWILYAPILAAGTYLALRRFVCTATTPIGIWNGLVAALLLSNLAFSGGRAGMAMFVALFIALIFEQSKTRVSALVACGILLPTIFFSAYQTSDFLADRVDHVITDLRVFNENPNTAVGLRLVYWATSFKVFSQAPIVGVGSGDFKHEYIKAKPTRWALTPDSHNPHNQFLLTAATTGLVGLAALLLIFYIAASMTSDARVWAILAGFVVVCMFESYLWRSNTALTFSVMLATFLANRSVESKT